MLLFLLAVVGAALMIGAGMAIARAARDRTYSDVSAIPRRRVGLVLGCPKLGANGRANAYFEYRIDAAAALFHQGKIEYLVVSGDNHVRGYDEPTDMRDALLEKGVPSNRIYLDYAGFRTLDSVVRVKEIFGQEQITVVSQRFHNERAIFLAVRRGVDAIGFNAAEVSFQYGLKTRVREQFARVKAVLDIYLFRTRPHFLGEKVTIGEQR